VREGKGVSREEAETAVLKRVVVWESWRRMRLQARLIGSAVMVMGGAHPVHRRRRPGE
jgi:hypothetical protein